MTAKLKKCGQCKKLLPSDIFVNWSSEYTAQGKYCRDCHIKMAIDKHYNELNESILILKILFETYNYDWDKVCLPCWLESQIIYESDYCIYCGNEFSYDNYGRLKANIDHMNPAALGGEDSVRNVIYVCSKCNVKKGSLNFTDWLNKLDPDNKRKAKEKYLMKHGYEPENYIPGESTSYVLHQGTSMFFDKSILREIINSDNLNSGREPVCTIKNRKSYEYFIDLSNKMIDDYISFLKETFKEFFPNDLVINKFVY